MTQSVNLIADFASIMNIVFGIIVALLALLVMVVIHEAGHYSMGKLLGFKINEFAIGFGKPIYKRKLKSGEQFSIRPFPLGGFCSFEGEDEENPDPGAFNNQKPWKRLIVLFAGAFFNFVSAILIISLTYTFYGDTLPIVASVDETPAGEESVFKVGDIFTGVDGKSLSFFNSSIPSVPEGTERTFDVLRKDENGNYYKTSLTYTVGGYKLSISYGQVRYNFFEAIGKGFLDSFRMVAMILESFVGLFTGSTGVSDLGGPVTMISIMGQSVNMGLGFFMYIVCLLSANLAIFNLLPIPALDGSRMVFVAIEWIRGKPVNRNVEGYIHLGGLVLLFGFAILIDLIKLF